MTVLITGANRGVGLELARHYSNAGTGVIATTRGEIPADLKDRAEWHRLNVTDPASHKTLAAALDGRNLDLLICNAGVLLDRRQSLADGYDAQLWADTFAVNVTGVFLTVQALLPNLSQAKGAKIAVIASRMGSDHHASGGSLIYRASKAAAVNLVRNLACDLTGTEISIGAFHPGWVQTDMGGASADITPQTSAKGLAGAIATLSPATSGSFLNYDGTPIAF